MISITQTYYYFFLMLKKMQLILSLILKLAFLSFVEQNKAALVP